MACAANAHVIKDGCAGWRSAGFAAARESWMGGKRQSEMSASPIMHWCPHFALGITGHRINNAAFTGNVSAVTIALSGLFDEIDRLCANNAGGEARVRLHNLLANGVDEIAADAALERGWSLVAPLPFGPDLNCAINSGANTIDDFNAVCEGRTASDPQTAARATAIRTLENRASVFAIADRDDAIRKLALAKLADPADEQVGARLTALYAINTALAGRVMLERCDLLIAVWDGATTDFAGGTGHTIKTALEMGTPVLIMDPASPEEWTVCTLPEELAHPANIADPDLPRERLATLAKGALASMDQDRRVIEREQWRAKAGIGLGFYRRLERLFGGRSNRSGTVSASYEAPEAIAQGSAASTLEAAQAAISQAKQGIGTIAGAGADGSADTAQLRMALRQRILPTFAWADGVSSRLADAYRSGMSLNFLLSALAIIAGAAYLPLDLSKYKWVFASLEFLLLLAILVITYAGYRRAWHRRWFETRRLAEYLRFAPGMLLIGVARPIGRWPRSDRAEWPERFARDALRDAGLPNVAVDRPYMRRVLNDVILPHVRGQRRYHEAKAGQLETAHHRIDLSAEVCFIAAIVSVLAYLVLEVGALAGIVPQGLPYAVAKTFTFLGVAFPTLGANLAGLRYFGDFDRFAAISRVTASQLRNVETRIELLLSGDPERLTYDAARELVRTVEEIVVSEIEGWQAVFGSKHLSLPA